MLSVEDLRLTRKGTVTVQVREKGVTARMDKYWYLRFVNGKLMETLSALDGGIMKPSDPTEDIRRFVVETIRTNFSPIIEGC